MPEVDYSVPSYLLPKREDPANWVLQTMKMGLDQANKESEFELTKQKFGLQAQQIALQNRVAQLRISGEELKNQHALDLTNDNLALTQAFQDHWSKNDWDFFPALKTVEMHSQGRMMRNNLMNTTAEGMAALRKDQMYRDVITNSADDALELDQWEKGSPEWNRALISGYANVEKAKTEQMAAEAKAKYAGRAGVVLDAQANDAGFAESLTNGIDGQTAASMFPGKAAATWLRQYQASEGRRTLEGDKSMHKIDFEGVRQEDRERLATLKSGLDSENEKQKQAGRERIANIRGDYSLERADSYGQWRMEVAKLRGTPDGEEKFVNAHLNQLMLSMEMNPPKGKEKASASDLMRLADDELRKMFRSDHPNVAPSQSGKLPSSIPAMPATKAELETGKVYMTPRGAAKWDGQQFIPQ